jgi:hypothetical protein
MRHEVFDRFLGLDHRIGHLVWLMAPAHQRLDLVKGCNQQATSPFFAMYFPDDHGLRTRREPWEPSSTRRHEATTIVIHAGSASDVRSDLSATALGKRKGPPSGKQPSGSMVPAARAKLGRHTTSASMRVPLSWPFFLVLRVSPSGLAWSWRSLWWVSRLGPVAFAWCVCYANSLALIALSPPPRGRSNRVTVRWRRRS